MSTMESDANMLNEMPARKVAKAAKISMPKVSSVPKGKSLQVPKIKSIADLKNYNKMKGY